MLPPSQELEMCVFFPLPRKIQAGGWGRGRFVHTLCAYNMYEPTMFTVVLPSQCTG